MSILWSDQEGAFFIEATSKNKWGYV